MKRCNVCAKQKPKSEYYTSNGCLEYCCKECKKAANKVWRAKNIVNRRKKEALYRKRNKKQVAKNQAKYYRKNKEYFKERTLEWYRNKRAEDRMALDSSRTLVPHNHHRIVGDQVHILLDADNTCIIDLVDWDKVKDHWWYAHVSGYAYVSYKQQPLFMHSLILDTPEGMQCDHIDGNKLLNIRSNLRIATRSQNLHNVGKRVTNTSGYIGVSRHSSTGKWQAKITVKSKQMHLGVFDDPRDAAKAYDEAKIKLLGEFARTNKGEGLL